MALDRTETGPDWRERDWGIALEGVLENPESIGVHFQPIVDLRRGVACGYEMLARFPGDHGFGPDVWFDAARRLGVSPRLESLLVRRGLSHRDQLPPNCFLTINVGPEDLGSAEIQGVIDDAAELDAIVFELTEHTTIPDPDLERALAPIRERGGMIALDDVGAGYSGLGRMNRIRPDFLKIDRHLIAGIDREPAKLGLVESLGAVAGLIDAWITVEGIETTGELDAVIGLDVPLAQGYGLGRPAPVMTPLDPDIARHIHDGQAFRSEHQEFAGMVDRVKPIIAPDGPGSLERRFAEDADVRHVPILDARERPAALARRSGDGGPAVETKPLLMGSGSRLGPITQRAMTRPWPDRFDPLVFTDDTGRYIGLVSVERLVDALAEGSG